MLDAPLSPSDDAVSSRPWNDDEEERSSGDDEPPPLPLLPAFPFPDTMAAAVMTTAAPPGGATPPSVLLMCHLCLSLCGRQKWCAGGLSSADDHEPEDRGDDSWSVAAVLWSSRAGVGAAHRSAGGCWPLSCWLSCWWWWCRWF